MSPGQVSWEGVRDKRATYLMVVGELGRGAHQLADCKLPARGESRPAPPSDVEQYESIYPIACAVEHRRHLPCRSNL